MAGQFKNSGNEELKWNYDTQNGSQGTLHPAGWIQAVCPNDKLEANIVELQDRSHRDNVCIINLPEKVENSDAADFVSSLLTKWFPTLTGGKMEVMRAHRIGPDHNPDLQDAVLYRLGLHLDGSQRLSDWGHFPRRWRQWGNSVSFLS